MVLYIEKYPLQDYTFALQITRPSCSPFLGEFVWPVEKIALINYMAQTFLSKTHNTARTKIELKPFPHNSAVINTIRSLNIFMQIQWGKLHILNIWEGINADAFPKIVLSLHIYWCLAVEQKLRRHTYRGIFGFKAVFLGSGCNWTRSQTLFVTL